MKYRPSATTKLAALVGTAAVAGGAYNASQSAPWEMSMLPMAIGALILGAGALLALIEWRASRGV